MGGKGCRCIGLTTLPPSCADCLESGSLILLEPSGPVQVWMFYLFTVLFLIYILPTKDNKSNDILIYIFRISHYMAITSQGAGNFLVLWYVRVCTSVFFNVWVFVYMGFVMCGCVDVWEFWQLCGCFGNMCTCIYCVFVLFRLCIFILIFY